MAEAVTAAQTSVVIPAFNEARRSRPSSAISTSAARWLEILVVDDGSSDDTGAQAAAAARASSAIRTTKATAPRSRPASASAGRFILIADADGQHRPADATRLVAQLDTYDLVVGARSGQTQASLARRLGNSALNRIASYLTEQPIPD
jgi:glycosyltransferase involved in cell wall biosynthesis